MHIMIKQNRHLKYYHKYFRIVINDFPMFKIEIYPVSDLNNYIQICRLDLP